MTTHQTKRCAFGSCRSSGTLQCGKCRVIFYCSKACQKEHWAKHKQHCSTYVPMPAGTFKFLDLNRETRNKVYEDLLVARYTPDQQAEHDSLLNATGDPFSIRNLIDGVEEHLMISPGTPLWGVAGYQPLVKARGLLNANKQINAELTSTLFTKNIFLIPVSEYFRYQVTGQLFTRKLDLGALSQIKHLVISVRAQLDIKHPHHGNGVAALKHNFNHIVKSLNKLANNLESLKIRFISSFAGRVEEMRGDIDPLLTQPTARPVQIMRMDDTVFTFTRNNVRRFYTSGFDLADAFEGLEIPVENFSIYGDLPGQVVERLNRKFKAPTKDNTVNTTGSDDHGPAPASAMSIPAASTSAATASTASTATGSASSTPGSSRPATPVTLPLDPTGQSRNDLADLVRGLADKNPQDPGMADLADRLARIPIRSREVNAMLFAPPTPEEMDMIRQQCEN